MARLDQTEDTELVDYDGYPTDVALDRLRAWDAIRDPAGLFAFLRSIWWAADWGWTEEDVTEDGERKRQLRISTGGWSGNEEALDALDENRMVRVLYWVSERRGGHYVYEYKL